MSAPETGFSTRSIIAAQDDQSWRDIEAAMRADPGITLFRPPRIRDSYYTDEGSLGVGRRSLNRTRVLKLERDGVLRLVGADRYGLVTRRG